MNITANTHKAKLEANANKRAPTTNIQPMNNTCLKWLTDPTSAGSTMAASDVPNTYSSKQASENKTRRDESDTGRVPKKAGHKVVHRGVC